MEGDDRVVVEDDLSSFREQWRRELGDKTGAGSEKNSQEKELQPEKEEDQEDDVHVKVYSLVSDLLFKKYGQTVQKL